MLIERDRFSPRVFLRDLPGSKRADRVAAVRHSRFVVDAERPVEVRGGDRTAADRSRWYPRDTDEAGGMGADGAIGAGRGGETVYEAHRVPRSRVWGLGEVGVAEPGRFEVAARKSDGWPVDSVGRFIDVFV